MEAKLVTRSICKRERYFGNNNTLKELNYYIQKERDFKLVRRKNKIFRCHGTGRELQL